MKNLFLIIFIAVNLYTPYSLWSSIVFNCLFAIYIALACRITRISKVEVVILMISSLLLFWSVIISLLYNSDDIVYVVGRHGRIVVNTILLSFIIRNLNFTHSSLWKAIGVALVINIIVIYIQTIFPFTKEYFFDITEHTKGALEMRSFGLYSSYDTCGLNVCLGICFWGIELCYHRKILHIIPLTITFLSSLFVSRYTIIISFIIFVVIVVILLKTYKKIFIPIIILSIIGGNYFYNHAIHLLDYNRSGYENEVDNSYSKYSYDVLTGRMLFLPDNTLSLFFGEGTDPKNSDIGYIKLIFMIGLSGLLMIVYLYIYSIYYTKNQINKQDKDQMRLYWYAVLLIILMAIFNFKLLLLYGKGVHDLYLITIFVLNKKINRKRININD